MIYDWNTHSLYIFQPVLREHLTVYLRPGQINKNRECSHRVVRLMSPPSALVEMVSLFRLSLPDKSLQRETERKRQ